ncbi:hypothetical protein L6R46_19090, partial [Myxococcota bacterium]|nr:hypothetical protein [Myxococcota bacterium]
MSQIDLDANLSDLSRDDFKDFFDGFLGEGNVREQSVVKGTVIDIIGDWVMVDVGYKAEGRISAAEFKDADGNLLIHP